MRIIAYYPRLDQNIMRRIIGPFSVLSQRGLDTRFMQIADPAYFETANYRLIFLPNAAYDGTLPKAQGEYCFDLSDAELLSDERVINVLQQCSYVTAPTETLAKLARPFCPRAYVMPSLVHSEWLYSAQVPRPTRPIVAAIGDTGWDVLLAPLLTALKEFPEILVATTNAALYGSLPEKRRAFIAPDVALYPKFVRSCYLCILPGERREIDPAPIYEFGAFGIPSIVGPAWAAEVKEHRSGVVASDTNSFLSAFRELTQDDRARSLMGNAAYTAARQQTAVRGADAWLRSVTKFCPTSGQLPTLK